MRALRCENMSWQDALMLWKNEKVVESWKGDHEVQMKGAWHEWESDGRTVRTQKIVKQKKSGLLVLTNQRLIWVEERKKFGKYYHPTLTIALENVRGISRGGFLFKHVSISDALKEHVFHLSGVRSKDEFSRFYETIFNQENAWRVREKSIEDGLSDASPHTRAAQTAGRFGLSIFVCMCGAIIGLLFMPLGEGWLDGFTWVMGLAISTWLVVKVNSDFRSDAVERGLLSVPIGTIIGTPVALGIGNLMLLFVYYLLGLVGGMPIGLMTPERALGVFAGWFLGLFLVIFLIGLIYIIVGYYAFRAGRFVAKNVAYYVATLERARETDTHALESKDVKRIPSGLRASVLRRSIRDETVRAKTGKGWDEWFAILDAWGSKEKGHTQSAKHLREHYELSPWWAQTVTIRYEWERGLRK